MHDALRVLRARGTAHRPRAPLRARDRLALRVRDERRARRVVVGHRARRDDVQRLELIGVGVRLPEPHRARHGLAPARARVGAHGVVPGARRRGRAVAWDGLRGLRGEHNESCRCASR